MLDVVFHFVDRRVHLPDGLVHLLEKIAHVERFLAGDRGIGGRYRHLFAAGRNGEESAADEPLGLNGCQRIGADQRVKILGDLELDAKLVQGARRSLDLLHGSCLGA